MGLVFICRLTSWCFDGGDSRRVFHGFLAFSPATQGQTAGDSKLRNWPDPPARRKWVQLVENAQSRFQNPHVSIRIPTHNAREHLKLRAYGLEHGLLAPAP